MATQADRLRNNLQTIAGGAATEIQKPARTFEDWMGEMEKPLSQALPSFMPVERFMRMVVTNYKMTEGLRECSMQSILGGALQAAQLGLVVGPGLGHAWLVPYNNYKGKDQNGQSIFAKEAQMQIGYLGYVDMGYRTGKIGYIDLQPVFESDKFDFEYGTREFIHFKPMGMETDADRPTHFILIIHFINGQKTFMVRTYNQMLRHAMKYTDMFLKKDGVLKTGENGKPIPNPKSNWWKNFNQMALKTLIREKYKTLHLSTDIHLALAADGSVKQINDAHDLTPNMAEETINLAREEYSVADADPIPEPPEDKGGF